MNSYVVTARSVQQWGGSAVPAMAARRWSTTTRLPAESARTSAWKWVFNSEYFLKGTVHELGHALGLSHLGPDPSLKLGNSLIGPNVPLYIERNTRTSIRSTWTRPRPRSSGSTLCSPERRRIRYRQPSVKLVDYKPAYSRVSNRNTLAGKLVSDMPAHSVVVIDDLGQSDEYWFRGHAGRIAADGTFPRRRRPPRAANGHFRILFCFDNGMVTGDGAGVVWNDRGEIEGIPL